MKPINMLMSVDINELKPGDIFEDAGIWYIVTDIHELPTGFKPSCMSCAAQLCINLDSGEHVFYDGIEEVTLLRRGVRE